MEMHRHFCRDGIRIVGCSGVGDVNGDGYLDYTSVGDRPYFLLNNGGTSFTRTSSNLPADIASVQFCTPHAH